AGWGRDQATRADGLVARGQPVGGGGEGVGEGGGVVVAVDGTSSGRVAQQLNRLAIGEQGVAPPALQGGGDEAMEGSGFARPRFAGDDEAHGAAALPGFFPVTVK